ncbi:hypothetical protein P280DRAFT_517582 [Massarina eburnea CBS 473.64]|uniref:Uncharacterized protein n=1 Tax=Massarina eburnea CBS 473.64 TaxID=1395130 RepID=A0A6A6S4N8_9PLEO|nr:hypothetical protein P280DRAFT_517582 [Massarina eburnea CBS 473.64]
MDAQSQASRTASAQDGTGLRKALRRWRDRWRLSSSASLSSRNSISAPTTRPPTTTSSIAPSSSTSLRLSPVPGASSYPPPAALFTPTTSTFIHSPADPRNRHSSSNASSPSNTLKKIAPLARRDTAPADYLASLASGHPSRSTSPFPPVEDERPMGMTTTIVANNASDSLRKKRSSRFRLSISKRASAAPQSLYSSSSAGSLYDRSNSRATMRFDTVEEGGELKAPRKRADTKMSDPETLKEEDRCDEDGDKECDRKSLVVEAQQLAPDLALSNGPQSGVRTVEVSA